MPHLRFTAGEGWINDPLGLTYHNGKYHLFFQYLPHGVAWTPSCAWGHATSPDLFAWTEEKVALSPGDGDEGCWSGSVVRPSARDAVMFYTSVQLANAEIGRVRTARPVDSDWRDWAKEEFVADPPTDVELTNFRDPFVFRDAGAWWMLVGAGRADGVATAFAYRSTDLPHVHTGRTDPGAVRCRNGAGVVWTGSMWECVQLVSVGDSDLLVLSVYDQKVLYHVACADGAYTDGRYEPDD